MQNDAAVINLNRSQAMIHVINANVTHCLWPRATGKTEGGAGPRIIHLSEVMPRSQIIFASDTFKRIEETLIPNVLNFIANEMGIKENEDYVVFKKPPDHWTKPLIVPKKFDRVISFKSGLVLCCGATSVDGSFNGFNAQAAIIDETKWVKEDRIKSQLFKALRGAFKYFGHLPEYRSVWTFTDKYEGDIKWILKLRDQQDEKLIKAVFTMALKVEEWKKEMLTHTSSATKAFYNKKIIEAETKLNAIRKELIYVSDAKPFENIENLGEKYYRDAKRDCKSIHEYNIAILNKDPTQAEHTFYPTLTDDNLYESDDDVQKDKPLIIAIDYNWRINPLVVAQLTGLHNSEYASLNIVRSMHVLFPDGLNELIDMFAKSFVDHEQKLVYYVYDKTAIGKDPARESFNVIVKKRLRLNGWRVQEVYIGEPPEHDIKFEKIKMMLNKRGANSINLNKLTNHQLLLCLQQAGTINTNGKTQKDKRPEKDPNFPAEEATDYTDAFDQILWACNELKVVKPSSSTSASIRLS